MSEFLRASVSNGNPREQALIRRWWHTEHGGRGTIVWEYCLEGLYADAIWFPDTGETSKEESGQQTAIRFPLKGREIYLCEAKVFLTPELIGQALVYRWYAEKAGATVKGAIRKTAGKPPRRSASLSLFDRCSARGSALLQGCEVRTNENGHWMTRLQRS